LVSEVAWLSSDAGVYIWAGNRMVRILLFSGGCNTHARQMDNESGKTILLVEDKEDNRIVYSTNLKHFGDKVTEAWCWEEGTSKARSGKPDLILMDISIPIIDGWEATQVLKHDPATKHIPIIALTAHALASDRDKAYEVGCDGYLAKPCEPRAVVAEVQRFLGRNNGH
jgi:two-component system cell cycle response regulator DivK